TVPLPPGPFGDFKALFDPGAQPIPGCITGLRRQIGQDQPWVLIAVLPQDQQGALHLPPGFLKGSAPAPPARPRLGGKALQGAKAPRPSGRKVPPVLMRKNGCQPRRTIRQNSHGAYKPRSVHTSTGQPRG